MDVDGRRDLAASIYQRVIVKDDVIQQVELTPSAYAHGAALALPDHVLVTVARPAGVGPGLTTCLVPLEGRDEWMAAAQARSA
jgi:hypothetical protein